MNASGRIVYKLSRTVADSHIKMPLYELLCLARPLLPKAELQSMISRVGGLVYDKGGVVTEVVSYGKQALAYKIKGVRGKYDEVS